MTGAPAIVLQPARGVFHHAAALGALDSALTIAVEVVMGRRPARDDPFAPCDAADGQSEWDHRANGRADEMSWRIARDDSSGPAGGGGGGWHVAVREQCSKPSSRCVTARGKTFERRRSRIAETDCGCTGTVVRGADGKLGRANAAASASESLPAHDDRGLPVERYST